MSPEEPKLPPGAGPIFVAADPPPPKESAASKNRRRRAALRDMKLAALGCGLGLAGTVAKTLTDGGALEYADWVAYGVGAMGLLRGTLRWAQI